MKNNKLRQHILFGIHGFGEWSFEASLREHTQKNRPELSKPIWSILQLISAPFLLVGATEYFRKRKSLSFNLEAVLASGLSIFFKSIIKHQDQFVKGSTIDLSQFLQPPDPS